MIFTRTSTKMRSLFILFCLGIFCACGLDEVTYVSEPSVTNNSPLYYNSDYLTWYSDFTTAESNQAASFIGTDVYYKIYNNYSTLVSQRNSILAVNTASNGTSAATRMIESYTFQPLGTNRGSDTVFVTKSGSNKRIRIRLKTYKGNESYSGDDMYTRRACVIGGKFGTDGSFVPYRNGNSKSFDFFNDANNNVSDPTNTNVEPVNGDSDYNHNSSASETNTYYVQLFAVGVVFDSNTLSNSFSLVLDLGSVPIRKGN
ncbi:MAG: hypothetical protein IJP61_02570 [Treponema sp.]|nr:hypothetical protein [Treponema sp.]